MHDIEVFVQILFTGNKIKKYYPHIYKRIETIYGSDWRSFYDKPKAYPFYEAFTVALTKAFKLI